MAVVIGPAADADYDLTHGAARSDGDKSFLAALRGRRRRLGDMTSRDDDNELRLFGFRFCMWLERWRLAATVMHVAHQVSYAQLGKPGVRESRIPVTTVTTGADEVLEDKVQIYHVLARAATACEGWMARLSDDDITFHIDTCSDLGSAVHTLLSSNTSSHYDTALLQLLSVLSGVDKNSDLARFVRKYRHASDGTHFLDAFYAPILLRLHLLNCYLGVPVIDFAGQFPTLHLWLQKFLSWTLLQSTLGEDFGPELLAYYADRGSYILNSVFIEESKMEWHAKFTPGVWLRGLRLRACEKWIGGAAPDENGDGEGGVGGGGSGGENAAVTERPSSERLLAAQRVFCFLVVEQKHLLKYSGVDVKLQHLGKYCKSLEEHQGNLPAFNKVWKKFTNAFRVLSEVAFGPRVKVHLMENVSLSQLWSMESEIAVELNGSGVARDFMDAMLEIEPLEQVVRFVQAAVDMVLIADDADVTLAMTHMLQMLYRQSNPSDWFEISTQVSLVQGLVLAKENWQMHYKYPSISLISAFYSFLKQLVMSVHGELFKNVAVVAGGSNGATASNSSSSSLSSSSAENLDAAVPDGLARPMEVLQQLTRLLGKFIASHYAAFCPAVEVDSWNRTHATLEGHFGSLLRALGGGVKSSRKFRLMWKKLKKELVLHLRSQKKLLLPRLLRFEEGERLVEAQVACIESCDEQTLRLLMEQVTLQSGKEECRGVWNVLRFHRPALYRACLALFEGRKQVLEQAGLGAAAEEDWLKDAANWPLHPKFAGVPFILGLANRVLLDDLRTVVAAARRALKGLGELPTTDIRGAFEIFYAHYISHRKMVLEPVFAALSLGEADGTDAEACDLETRIAALEAHIDGAERDGVTGPARRAFLQEALKAAEALLLYASESFGSFSAKYVPRCISGFTYSRSMTLFGDIVHMYHSCNPHLLSRTIASLSDSEYGFFCRNILSLPFPLLKDVLDSLHAEIPTRMWLRLVDTMPCLSGVALDAKYWPAQPHYGGVPLFWQLSHRWLEQQISLVLVLSNDKNATIGSAQKMVDASQRLMLFLEKHGAFEDGFLLPRIGSAVPTVAETCFEDTTNEHALLESNELRVIAIVKASLKCLQTQPDVVPVRQLNRMKRQVRSYQTLILPHLDKEEVKYMPVMLTRFTANQWRVLARVIFNIYGRLLDPAVVISMLKCASQAEQRILLQSFVPMYCLSRQTHQQQQQQQLQPQTMDCPHWSLFTDDERLKVPLPELDKHFYAQLKRSFPNL